MVQDPGGDDLIASSPFTCAAITTLLTLPELTPAGSSVALPASALIDAAPATLLRT